MKRDAAQLWKRLSRMPAREVIFRTWERLRSEAERAHLYLPPDERACLSGFSASAGATGTPFKNYLSQGPARRFYLPSSRREREAARELICGAFPEWKARAIEEAERLCRHRVEILGFGHVALGDGIDWHRDPITGSSWPVRFWADYDLMSDNSTGDPKVIHELNRHQHLPRLAKAYFLSGDERYAREVVRQLTGWISQNPPGMGIHWHSSLEIALRSLSWFWSLFYILPSEALDENSARSIGGSLLAQLDHVSRHLSEFSSPNTHLLGEAAALFIGGSLFSEVPRCRVWQDHGASILVREIDAQVSKEGIHRELSSYYHCYALDFYLQVLTMASRNGYKFPDRVWSRTAWMTDFVMHLTRPDGSIPLLGDDDGGRALALLQTSYGSFLDGLCTAAVLFQRPDWKYLAGEFHEETFWLLGEQAWSTYAGLESSTSLESGAAYPDAGYFIQRSGWDSRAAHLVFDCGGMGMINGGHAHADSLALNLSIGGKELLIDPGTCVYNAAPEWRSYFRSARAHNTLVVDGRDQSRSGGTFRWIRAAKSRVIQHEISELLEYVAGEHDGYLRRPNGVIHRRRVLRCRPEYWVVVDDLRGAGEHDFELFYHLGADATAWLHHEGGARRELDLSSRAADAGLRLFLHSSAPFRTELLRGQEQPIQGWASRRYGERTPALTLRIAFRSVLPAAVITLLIPSANDRAQPHYEIAPVSSSADGLACRIQRGGRTDLAAWASEQAEFDFMKLSMRAEFCWLRIEEGAPERLFAVNASRIVRDGHVYVSEHTSQRCVWRTLRDDIHRKEFRDVCAESAAS
jgi:hypothetical protein